MSSKTWIANAVWYATGVRVRRFPITVEQLIGAGAV
jgi:CO/xanthine dehydrogenase Mo-binding subunit